MAAVGDLWKQWSTISPVTVFSAILVTILAYVLFSGRKRYPNPLPPSPGMCLPVVGHLFLLKEDMREPLRMLRKQLGDVYSLSLGNKHVVFVSGYSAIREMFIEQSELYENRPHLPVAAGIVRFKGLIWANGLTWKMHRKFALSTLKHLGMGKTRLEVTMQHEAKQMIAAFDANVGKDFDPRQILDACITNIIFHMLFAGGFKAGDPKFTQMMSIMDLLFKKTPSIANYLPFLLYVPGDPTGARKSLSESDKLFQFIYDVIDDPDTLASDSFVKAYLLELEKQQQDSTEPVFSREELASTFLNLFAAGSETSLTAIRWCFVNLIRRPDIQDRLFTEIVEQIGHDRDPSVNDRLKLPFMEAFTSEVMRYHTLLPQGLLHGAVRDTVFRGFTIPKSSIIIPDLESVARDVSIWGDPDNFRPERFLDGNGLYIHRDEHMPFFVGKRSCLGEALGRAEMFLFLASVVQNFRLDPSPDWDYSTAAIDGVFGVVHGPKPFNLRMTRR